MAECALPLIPGHGCGSCGIENVPGVEQIAQTLFRGILLNGVLIQAVAVQVPPGHTEVAGALLHPVGGAGVHITEIAEALGLQILEPGVVLGVGVEIRDVVAEGVEDDVRGSDKRFHLGFPAVRVVPEALILDGKAVEGLSGLSLTPSFR